MLTRHFSRDSIKADEGQPRVVRMVLCDNHGYLTFAGDCGCSIQHDYERFAVVGTTYGWLHSTAGDKRFWKSESGARHALKAYKGEQAAVVPPLECAHADTCLPDYWGGHHAAHIQVPVYKGMHLSELKSALHSELNQGAVMGSDERTFDNSGAIGDAWYKRAHAAINRIKPAVKGKRRLFEDLEESSAADDGCATVYAYFVFIDKE